MQNYTLTNKCQYLVSKPQDIGFQSLKLTRHMKLVEMFINLSLFFKKNKSTTCQTIKSHNLAIILNL